VLVLRRCETVLQHCGCRPDVIEALLEEATMSDWSHRLQEFVDSIAASVAVVGRDEKRALFVPACNQSFFDMTGGRPMGAYDFPLPFDTLIPSYARHEFREKLKDCFDSGIADEFEQAYDLKEDGTHWWRLSLKPFRHTEGGDAVLEILITGLEITAKMELTHQLEISTSRFRSVVDAAYDAIITIDQEHNITLFNRAAENLFGYEASEMLGQPLLRLIPEPHRSHHDTYVHQFARSPVMSRQMNERNRIYAMHRDGSLLPVEIAISKINVEGLLEFTAVIRDIADRIRLMDLFQRQAETDELTGVPNRREFLEVMENIIRSNQDVSVLMLDIDFFKKVNDTYGHDCGDEALKYLAKAATSVVAAVGIFARWGGEEFMVALPKTGLEAARSIAERVRATIEHQDFKYDWPNDKAIPFTVSIGVVTRTPDDHDLWALLKRVDQALYKAKGSGRNRVETG
jgi:diguanylate cyclase (GGDEF)-like protein/PAS domain S-box-containing protein